MKNIFAKISKVAATSAALTVAIAGATNNSALAVDFNFNWLGDAGYSATGSFSYDEATAPTIISESGSGATDYLQSLSVSFLDPSNNLLGTYNTVAGGVSQSNFFSFNFDTSTKSLFGSFNVGGGTGVIGEYFFLGTIGDSLELRQDVDQAGTSTRLDQNSGSIQVYKVPEPGSMLGLLALAGLGVGTTLKKSKSLVRN
ncbi:PEP-CTERM sorting domain-containing protein [Nostoc sp. CENA67]|uniref:PEP-CTERM sorting domain-containing protein n=1 Tax=Amazonocrinis nigriterrae CENA67 TaxID=2794033 RepID=A0A8J7HX13_9NOST|nr:PEP-CTERM sorting domain-containing protein [Amazonocrinis nigriterrae]MBH8565860.1 PEP-CTERM sorting domain-containing protein [Amazonocrinis nigriterrae CENA67]